MLRRWSAAEWLEYLHGALRLSALALESAPEIGATTRELDKFGTPQQLIALMQKLRPAPTCH
eukprot:854747-Pleurochrysis_carterae.AAC.3